jgi:hypothetical protein
MLHYAINSLKVLFIFIVPALAMTSCLKDPSNPPSTPDPARARIEITDAPIDDANVKGVFITVVDIKVDGISWPGFDGKTTFDLLTFQKGQTKLLGEGELNAKTYTEIILVLDTDTDADGTSPGCYVKDAQDNKRKLSGGPQMIVKAKGSMATKAGETTEGIVDLNLRKSIIFQSGSSTEFQFVTDPELQTAVRLVNKAQTGVIAGDCTDGVSGSDKVIVYAYKKGSFDANMEKFPQGTSQIQFKNAITSSVLSSDGNFTLPFLEAGTYELRFISYKQGIDGKLQAKGELQLNVISSTLNLLGLNLTANGDINMDLVVTGILFF